MYFLTVEVVIAKNPFRVPLTITLFGEGGGRLNNKINYIHLFFYVLPTVHLSIFILVIV